MRILAQGIHAMPSFVHVGYCAGTNGNVFIEGVGENEYWQLQREKMEWIKSDAAQREQAAAMVASYPSERIDKATGVAPRNPDLLFFSSIILVIAVLVVIAASKLKRDAARRRRPGAKSAADRYRGKRMVKPPVFAHALQKAP